MATSRERQMRRWLFAVGPSVIAAGVGGWGARDAATVYGRLRKPRWAPPAGAFGPAWSALYVLIGVAGWRIGGHGSRRVQTLHLLQMALNTAWPAAFFAGRDKRVALAVIAGLDAVLLAELAELARTDRVAAALLAPYAGWTGYATALNAAVSEP